ncbi:helix-turn-helix transcriptional regulator [Bifidobacterium sp. 6T3]|uniref:Helix-turn-helix transcriptional regulator n=1 Tax=Bifidobacterium phasiani TaxID=2834431 RepID=A0ABS6WBW0_9BIFI|nr:helix-turn-helix transcriptional regulator [Bifidobacterium phasiani]
MERTQLQSTVTKNMRVALAANGLQQKDLANALGITSASMSAKFTGRTMWNLVDIEKASGFFHVKPEALVAGHGFEPWTSGL